MTTPTPAAPPAAPPAPAPSPPRPEERRQEQREPRPETREPERRPQGQEHPPWEREGGQPFDPERAWTQLQALRTERDRGREERDGLRAREQEQERSQMSDAQRLEADRDAQRSRADTAEAQLVAYRAAMQHQVPAADLEEFIELLGTGTPEQLATRAERLAPRFAAPAGSPRPTPPPSTRPTEGSRRRGGGDPGGDVEETNLDKIAERLMGRR